MEEEIKSVYKDADVELLVGSGGDFIVEVNGKVIFSKKEMSEPRFPENGEILRLISA
ncbi:MAG: Rdx family protein [Campylobacter sp.]|nr:Rdx family protein [Campylobacter sp.]